MSDTRNTKVRVGTIGVILLFIILFVNSTYAIIYPSYDNETDCRSCHAMTPVYIANRHHTLVANETYHCSDCHPLQYDAVNDTYDPEVIRDCLICHPGKNHKDVHHVLASQGLFECQDCHPLRYDEINQTWDPYVTYECTECHSTVRSIQNGTNETPVPTPTPTPAPPIRPSITSFDPMSPVNDTTGNTRTFRIISDQIVNVTWSVENVDVQTNEYVTDSNYTNISAPLGIWNITANASNENGTVKYTWLWNVSEVIRTPLEIEFYAPYPFPTPPVYDYVGNIRKFGLAINQFADVVWSINGTPIQFNQSTNRTIYTNNSAGYGTWIVNANATNANGTVNYTWLWIVQDNIPPDTSISLSGITGNNSWNTSNVYVNLAAVDTGSGLSATWYRINDALWNTYTLPFEITGEGTNNISYYSTDNANNVESIKYQTVKIDKSSPQITINTPANGSIYTLNQNLIANWHVNDIISGLSSYTGTYPNGSVINTNTGGTKYFVVNATDNAGNNAVKNNTYYIRYLFGGYLEPINNDNTSIFKLGSNIPIKFQLTDANGNWVANANASLTVSYVSSATGTINELVYNGATSSGYNFTYDANNHFYMYTLGTKLGFSQGKYKITSNINDGSSYSVLISLKR